jgi:hypothetical protein
MEGMTIDHKAIETAVIEKTVKGLVERYSYDDDLNGEIAKRAKEMVKERFDALIAPMIDKGISELVIQQTNSYGHPKAEPMSFAEFVTSMVDQHLKELVNSDGRPITDSYNRSSGVSRLQHIVRDSCKNEIAMAVAVVAKSIKDQIGEVMGQTVKKAIDEKLSKLNYV